MTKWLVEYWKQWNDSSTDFYLIVEARNSEEAIEIGRSRDVCGRNFSATEATDLQIKTYDR